MPTPGQYLKDLNDRRADFAAKLINEGHADPLAVSTIIQRTSTPEQAQKIGTRRAGMNRAAVAALPSLSVIAGSGGRIKPLNDTINALKVAISNAQTGDVVDCAGLTFILGSTQIALKHGVLIEGGVFRATPPKQGQGSPTKNCFAFVAPHGIRDFGFKGSVIESSNGVLFMEGGHGNFTFTKCRVKHGWDGTYYSRLVFWCGGGCDGVVIEDNDFFDSLASDRTMDVWGFSNFSYSYNRFFSVNDGGHIMEPGHNVRMIGNRFVRLRRMGIEIQQTTYPPKLWNEGLHVDGNVIESRELPFLDSMGFSVPVAGKAVSICDNYIRQIPYNGVWGPPVNNEQRGSYGIECPNGEAGPGNAFPHTIARNIIISAREVVAICSPGIQTPIKDNKAFGPYAWGVWIGEPGNAGYGSIVPTNCTHDPNAANAPAIPGGTLPPDPGPTPMPPTLTNPAKTSTSLTVAATGGVQPYKLNYKPRDNNDPWVVASTNWNGAPYTIDKLNPNWVYTVAATGKDGAVARIDVQTPLTDPVVPPAAKRKATKIIYDDGSEQVIA